MFSLDVKDTKCSVYIKEENTKSFNVDGSAWLRELISQACGWVELHLPCCGSVFLSVGTGACDCEELASKGC